MIKSDEEVNTVVVEGALHDIVRMGLHDDSLEGKEGRTVNSCGHAVKEAGERKEELWETG